MAILLVVRGSDAGGLTGADGTWRSAILQPISSSRS
jgi:hypothetical protein